jgi:hypothetical protein
MRRVLPLVLLALMGCAKAPPAGNPEFNDAVAYTLRTFDGEEVDLAYALRVLESNIYAGMDVEAESEQDRALTPERLTEEDVVAMEHPDRDPALALPVAVAARSPHPVESQRHVQMLTDHTPVEPYSPDYYQRTFLEGGDCWFDRACDRMNTFNDLVKKNALMEVPYEFYKDFRWIDMNLPDPEDVPEGEEPTNPGEERWAFVGRSWQEESFEGEGGDTALLQSFTIEVWIPREEGDGTLRMLAVWSETDLGIDFTDDQVAGTTRKGIDDNFKAADEWIAANVTE